MTDENVVNFPGKDKKTPKDTSIADEAIDLSRGCFEHIIIIGIAGDEARCLSTLSLPETIYELNRATYKIHGAIDKLDAGA